MTQIKLTKLVPPQEYKIELKNVNISNMEITASGLEMSFRPEGGDKQIGKLVITPTALIWEQGKTVKTGNIVH